MASASHQHPIHLFITFSTLGYPFGFLRRRNWRFSQLWHRPQRLIPAQKMMRIHWILGGYRGYPFSDPYNMSIQSTLSIITVPLKNVYLKVNLTLRQTMCVCILSNPHRDEKLNTQKLWRKHLISWKHCSIFLVVAICGGVSFLSFCGGFGRVKYYLKKKLLKRGW